MKHCSVYIVSLSNMIEKMVTFRTVAGW